MQEVSDMKKREQEQERAQQAQQTVPATVEHAQSEQTRLQSLKDRLAALKAEFKAIDEFDFMVREEWILEHGGEIYRIHAEIRKEKQAQKAQVQHQKQPATVETTTAITVQPRPDSDYDYEKAYLASRATTKTTSIEPTQATPSNQDDDDPDSTPHQQWGKSPASVDVPEQLTYRKFPRLFRKVQRAIVREAMTIAHYLQAQHQPSMLPAIVEHRQAPVVVEKHAQPAVTEKQPKVIKFEIRQTYGKNGDGVKSPTSSPSLTEQKTLSLSQITGIAVRFP